MDQLDLTVNSIELLLNKFPGNHLVPPLVLGVISLVELPVEVVFNGLFDQHDDGGGPTPTSAWALLALLLLFY